MVEACTFGSLQPVASCGAGLTTRCLRAASEMSRPCSPAVINHTSAPPRFPWYQPRGKVSTRAWRRAVRHYGAALPVLHAFPQISAEIKTCAVFLPWNRLEVDGRHEPVPSQERVHWTIERRLFVCKRSRHGADSVEARFTTGWRRGSSCLQYHSERAQ